MKYLISGGCGFIGSNLVDALLEAGHSILNLDKLSYAASRHLENKKNYKLLKVDLAQLLDRPTILKKIEEFAPDFVIHLAAESMVDHTGHVTDHALIT